VVSGRKAKKGGEALRRKTFTILKGGKTPGQTSEAEPSLGGIKGKGIIQTVTNENKGPQGGKKRRTQQTT